MVEFEDNGNSDYYGNPNLDDENEVQNNGEVFGQMMNNLIKGPKPNNFVPDRKPALIPSDSNETRNRLSMAKEQMNAIQFVEDKENLRKGQVQYGLTQDSDPFDYNLHKHNS